MALRFMRGALWLLPLALMTVAHAGAPPARGSRVIEGVAVASMGPLASVKVRAAHGARVVTTRTDAHGHFVLRGLSDGWWTLTASQGSEVGEVQVAPAAGDPSFVVLELGLPRTVRGVVRSDSGLPVLGARVEAGLQGVDGLRNPREYRTASKGRFELAVPGFSPIAVQVSAPGYISQRVTEASATGEWDVVLESAVELHGVVTDSHGTPVRGVRVRLKRYGRTSFPAASSGQDALTTTTDGDGTFAIGGLERGRYTFLLQPREHAALSGDVEVPTGEVRWTLPEGVRVSTTVTGPRGTPVPASVSFSGPLADPDFFPSVRTIETRAVGGTAVDGLVPGDYWVSASLRSGEEERSTSRKVRVSTSEEVLSLDFRGPHRLRGSVVDARGRPVRGVRVSLRHGEEEQADFSVMRRSVNGPFAFDSLPEGELTVVASKDGCELLSTTVRVPTSAPLRLVLKRQRSVPVSGRVVDERGRPIRSFRVNGTSKRHAAGRFSAPVSPGSDAVVLRISADGFAPRLLTVDPRQPASRKLGAIRLGSGRTLTGRVETPEGWELAGVTVRCRWPGAQTSRDPSACHGETFPDGSLYLSHVPAEPVLLELDHPDWPLTRLLMPEGVTQARVRLPQGLTVRGTVKDARGLPLEDGDVRVEVQGEAHLAPIRPDGTYVIRVSPGRGSIQVVNPHGEPAAFEGTEGQTARVDLRVQSDS
ncbi:carboxypeptidase regulatory-like domain-containing protein [Pyxidicoccus parkwayensis]|uniref:Carboxypeptidase regulatory-like domain-containing protein n=1 Tax=Pyxidicoccus parkwayensis TaxID=2813578 RepID=A0ABX7P999_9BACT|nr:carboxypeptidase regulatory-like domain-containing protein [Pyxidicoccus parkwaysis]QSQ27070.1 carboxypeptidase regulatory-like domain-containing protein [Pyxidicoccus parkwaysis]